MYFSVKHILLFFVFLFFSISCSEKDSKGKYSTYKIHANFFRIAAAIDNYMLDHSALPPFIRETYDEEYIKYSMVPESAYVLSQKYLKASDREDYFADPCSAGARLGYYGRGNIFVLYSCGPDGVYEINPKYIVKLETYYDADVPTVNMMYDPTNGFGSTGDLIYVGVSTIIKR